VTAFTGTSSQARGTKHLRPDHRPITSASRSTNRRPHGDTANDADGQRHRGEPSLAVAGSAILQAAVKVRPRRAGSRRTSSRRRRRRRVHRRPLPGQGRTREGALQRSRRGPIPTPPPGVRRGSRRATSSAAPARLPLRRPTSPMVEIDRDTGRVRLRDFVSVDDCGRAGHRAVPGTSPEDRSRNGRRPRGRRDLPPPTTRADRATPQSSTETMSRSRTRPVSPVDLDHGDVGAEGVYEVGGLKEVARSEPASTPAGGRRYRPAAAIFSNVSAFAGAPLTW